MKQFYSIFTSLLLMLLLSFQGTLAEEWIAPSSAKKKLNPYEASRKNISKGKKVYMTNCKSCHGEPTKDNAMPLVPKPTDLGSQTFLVQTDGEIYYKVKTGKGTMPTFDKTLNDENKWMVIAYLRSFDKNKKKTPAIAEIENPEVTKAFLKVDVDNNDHRLLAHLTGETPKGKIVNLRNIELEALVKRYFGHLNVAGENAYTDENGKLEIVFPHDLPGDTQGNLDLTVKVADEDLYGKLEVKMISNLGVPTNPKNPLDERAMWGTRANAPIWIILTFSLGVLGIWSVIFLVIFKTLQLKKLAGRKE
ncbi:MAG: cytochrome c [Marinifilaceae bacterium]